MLLGAVEESGDQHAHLTIWTILFLQTIHKVSQVTNCPEYT